VFTLQSTRHAQVIFYNGATIVVFKKNPFADVARPNCKVDVFVGKSRCLPNEPSRALGRPVVNIQTKGVSDLCPHRATDVPTRLDII
ncbi:hypothetical protein BaRGS_00007801, partial [Batillaria attramentaria]